MCVCGGGGGPPHRHHTVSFALDSTSQTQNRGNALDARNRIFLSAVCRYCTVDVAQCAPWFIGRGPQNDISQCAAWLQEARVDLWRVKSDISPTFGQILNGAECSSLSRDLNANMTGMLSCFSKAHAMAAYDLKSIAILLVTFARLERRRNKPWRLARPHPLALEVLPGSHCFLLPKFHVFVLTTSCTKSKLAKLSYAATSSYALSYA
jgi:hypothetical protein